VPKAINMVTCSRDRKYLVINFQGNVEIHCIWEMCATIETSTNAASGNALNRIPARCVLSEASQ
jgi:photosystem II stability/assembly factor-like uncharacterized protein